MHRLESQITTARPAESEYWKAVRRFIAGQGRGPHELRPILTAAGKSEEDFRRDVLAGGPLSTRGLS